MWDQTKIMAAIDSAKSDYGSPVSIVEVSVVSDDLRLVLKSVDGVLLATYLVALDGELTRLGD
tara:strand:+ start:2185 stop:2373 length:189 start_codon:yes stop_codon:yes gene_type:complete